MQTTAFDDSSSGSSRSFVECDGELFAQRFGVTRQRGERGVGVGVGFESRQRALAESRSLFDIGEAQALGEPFGLQQLDGLPKFGRRFIASGLEASALSHDVWSLLIQLRAETAVLVAVRVAQRASDGACFAFHGCLTRPLRRP